MRTVEELRELIVKHRLPFHGNDVGEILCYYIHSFNLTFKQLAKHFDITLNELAEVIADHIRKL